MISQDVLDCCFVSSISEFVEPYRNDRPMRTLHGPRMPTTQLLTCSNIFVFYIFVDLLALSVAVHSLIFYIFLLLPIVSMLGGLLRCLLGGHIFKKPGGARLLVRILMMSVGFLRCLLDSYDVCWVPTMFVGRVDALIIGTGST